MEKFMCGNYHKYIVDLENRKIIGNFDGAYKNCPEAWPSQHNIFTSKYRVITSYITQTESTVNVLDVGCGYGDYVSYLHKNGIDAVGCEISPTAVKAGIKRHPPGTKIEVGDLKLGLKYADDSFNVVLCLGVFQFLLDKLDSCLIELKRIMKKDGLLVLSVFIPVNPIGREYIKDYGDFMKSVRKHLYVKDVIMEYSREDLVAHKELGDMRESLVLFCEKAQ